MLNDKSKKNFKVSIIGTGFVGSSTAYALMLRSLASEIVLINRNENTAIAEKLDISFKIDDMFFPNVYHGSYRDIKDSDVIIVTCGRNRKPTETRLDMISDNLKIAEEVTKEIYKYYTGGTILVVSNPVDIITYKMTKWLNLPKGKVFGTGCILDSSRFTNVISECIIGHNYSKVNATVIGEHGESQVPLWSKVQIDNIPIKDYCEINNIFFDDKIKADISQQVTKMGTTIIKGKGRTNYGIATCVSYIIELLQKNNNSKKISVSSLIDGNEYGLNDVALSLPSIIDKNGIKKIPIEDINNLEYSLLKQSSNTVKEVLKSL